MNSFKEKFKIAKILASLFTHSSTPEEEKMYKEWIEGHPQNSELGTRILNQENYEHNNRLLQQFPPHNAWKRIKPLLDNRQIKIRPTWARASKYAAVILFILLPTFLLIYNKVTEKSISEIAPGVHDGEVTLSNGNTFKLSDHSLPEGAVKVFTIDTEGINYQTPSNKPQVKEMRNTLRTLHGMECHITLSDGTNVHLNAQTRLTYPICFSGKERIVEVEGEAYFNVATDKEHPFIIQTPHNMVKVTGTSFNIRAYDDEPEESVTLVNGSVTINHEGEEYPLAPCQHFVYDKNSSQASIRNVNTELYTSWESGAFFFINKPLEEVFAYLSKWYGFRYSFRDEAAGKVKIGAYLNRYKNMNPIIDMIEDLNLVRISQKDDTLYITTK